VLFTRRYRYDVEGLRELARHLASPDLNLQKRAADALRKDGNLRDVVRLGDVFWRAVEGELAAGRSPGNPIELEKVRPLATIVPRLRELCAAGDRRIRNSAQAAIDFLRAGDSNSRRG